MQMLTIESTTEANNYLHNLSLDNSDFRFRGQADFVWPLTPSIYRYCSFKRYQAIIHERDLMFFRPKFPMPPLTYTNFEIEWLMVCQHNNVPTRLLDWSSDILTALFFCCYDKKNLDKDGALFICKKSDYPQYQNYQEKITKERQLVFINTTLLNPKMRNQAGSFMLWGASPLNDLETESYDLWKYIEQGSRNVFFEKILVPQNAKKRILQELDEIWEINEDNVFAKKSSLKFANSAYFQMLTERLRLMTLHQTNAGGLTFGENNIAKSFFRIGCENWVRECISLREYGDNNFLYSYQPLPFIMNSTQLVYS